MAGQANWLSSLFSMLGNQQQQAAPTTVVPATRVGNVYQGVALPQGKSSLLAMSEDMTKRAAGGKGQRQANKQDANTARRAAQAGVLPSDIRAGDHVMGQEAHTLMTMLFGDAQRNGWGMPNNDRQADRMLDRVGYFDPRGGSIDDRNARAIAEWQRRYGFGGR